MKKKPSRFTMILRIRCLNFKVTVRLALNRGEKLGVIKVNFKHNIEKMHRFYSARFKQKNDYIEEVINQSLKKKIIPAMERRIRSELTEAAEDGAIQSFLSKSSQPSSSIAT